MTWKCGLILSAAVLIVAGGLWISHLRTKNWLLQDKERVEEIERYRFLASEASDRADAAITRANELARAIERGMQDLEDSRDRLRKRNKPKSLKECEHDLDETDQHIAILDDHVNLLNLSNDALRVALAEEVDVSANLEHAWKLERERSDGFRKEAKRGRMKMILIGTGSAVGASLLTLGAVAAAR